MVEIYGHTFEHLTITRELGNPVRGYAVRTEEGYWIHKAEFGENVFKRSTAIYEDNDLDAIIIVHESELPEGAELLGGVTPPSVTE